MRNLQSRKDRCNSLVNIMLEGGLTYGKGNSRQHIANLAWLFYEYYHLDEYDSQDVFALFTILFGGVLAAENIQITSFGSIQAAFEALAPKFEQCVEAHADSADDWMVPRFMNEICDLASYISTSCHLYSIVEDLEGKSVISRAVKIAVNRVLSLGERLKTEQYLWRSDLNAMYQEYLDRIALDLRFRFPQLYTEFFCTNNKE